jgi:hypothetical protein
MADPRQALSALSEEYEKLQQRPLPSIHGAF